jgi:hypothetical protein
MDSWAIVPLDARTRRWFRCSCLGERRRGLEASQATAGSRSRRPAPGESRGGRSVATMAAGEFLDAPAWELSPERAKDELT